MMIRYLCLDEILRGTGEDPQAFADAHRMIVIADTVAARVGPCWYGAIGTMDAREAMAQYDPESKGRPEDLEVYVPR